ncbi:MAG: adenylate/guanylate cyclase domain-containing protein [Desulfuromonadaceae bacterium]|nr:adenylate/guanylate cyclase domain-containing protein [Desulfuromonadaceae bacterium]
MLKHATLISRYRWQATLTGTLLLLLILLAHITGPLTWLNQLAYDLHFQIRGPLATSGQVVLVYMDELSARELGRRQGNWSRQQLATALDNLTAAGSEIIGLDLLFTSPALDPAEDLLLTATIERCNNIILGRASAVPGIGAIEPLEAFRAVMIGDGFIDLPLDPDGCLRKVRFFNAQPLEDGSLQLLPSFSLELTRTFLNLDFAFDFSDPDFFTMGSPEQTQLKLPYPELLINYYGSDQVFPQLSYADVVMNRFAAEDVAGKLILIGSNLLTEKDYFNTSFTRYRSGHRQDKRFGATLTAQVHESKETGLSCHAHAVETLLNQSYISPLPTCRYVLLLLALFLFSQFLFYRRKSRMPAFTILLVGLTILLAAIQWAFNHRLWIPAPALLLLFTGQFLASFFLQRKHEKDRNQWITQVFGKYVSGAIVERLVEGEITPEMGGKRQDVTVFFADLRNFTHLAEELGAHDTALLLNRFFSVMIPVIQLQEGTVDKLIGDAILAFFGAPLQVDCHPDQAAAAALSMIEALKQLQQEDLAGATQLNLGIGLNSGEVTIGNLGCDAFMDYTVIGDEVNLASRLEGLNKIYGTRILMSHQCAQRLTRDFRLRELDCVVVKGKEKAVTLFELIGEGPLDEDTEQMLDCFVGGLHSYRQQRWDRAQQQFEAALQWVPEDGPSQLYLRRVAEWRRTPPPPQWDAITRFVTK